MKNELFVPNFKFTKKSSFKGSVVVRNFDIFSRAIYSTNEQGYDQFDHIWRGRSIVPVVTTFLTIFTDSNLVPLSIIKLRTQCSPI